MNSLFISFLVFIVFIFHIGLRPQIKLGKVKECFSAIWFIDTIFAICGTVISFSLYKYNLLPFLSFRNVLICLLYFILTALLLLVSPSGLSLFRKSGKHDNTDTLMAEYRFNDTLRYVRSFFMILLFTIPILMSLLLHLTPTLPFFSTWDEEDICGAICFISFLFLVPISLRQTLFWLRNLLIKPSAEEMELLKKNSAQIHFHNRNYRL